VFAIALDDVSLIDYVSPESSRQKLEEAQRQIPAGDTLDALDNIAVVFADMIAEYEATKRGQYGNSPFFFGRSMTFLDSFGIGLNRGASSSSERKLAEFVDSVKESIDAMQDAIKMLALGIDYRKYSRFKMLTPHLARVLSGDWIISRSRLPDHKPSQDDATFCVDFVVESALALAGFDYTVGT
jgi:hypothetical protein